MGVSCYTIGLGGVGVDGSAVRAVGSMGDWNQVGDGDWTKDSRSAKLDFVRMTDFM